MTTVDRVPARDPHGDTWRDRHCRAWARKTLLREYYQTEYFARIIAAMPRGRSLEIGAGAGLFAQYHRCDVVSDVTAAPHIDRVVDVHAVPFPDHSFECVVGIDVLHHLYHPAHAVAEMVRVLTPGGRIVLIEPWAGLFGIFVNKYLHTEGCYPIADPWGPAFDGSKHPMDGNATIPKLLFVDHADELPHRFGLRVLTATPFSCAGFLSTGGFTRWHLPLPVGRLIMAVESRLPPPVWRIIGVKMLIVAERMSGNGRSEG